MCEFRCELKPISAPCYAQLTQVKPDSTDEQIQPQENDEMFPEIRAGEEAVAMRLLISYKIAKADYMENPWKMECSLVHDLCAAFSLSEAQVGVLN